MTDSYNVRWRWDQTRFALIPIGAAGSSEVCQDSSLEVVVTNALTGEPVAGATVTVADQSGVTQTDGRVTLDGLPGDNVQVAVSAPGYLPQTTSVALECGGMTSIGISLLPAGDAGTARGDIRIVLTWGEEPHDLDSHLTGPRADNPEERFHVFYAAKNNCDASPCDPNIPAWLDVDDTTSYGPETITITKVDGHFVPGRYRYSVHHYSGDLNIPQSQATVKIFIGDRLVKTYTPPEPAPGQEVGDDWVWTVCDIMIDEQGNVSILDVNTYTGPTSPGDINSFSAMKTFLGVPVGPEDPALFKNLPAKN
ncbi:carboxypeptidase regulatory-like domain-containing protein [Thermosulfurimonas sp. F29]|uniref:carboxypeptidase regulatory-like domain-containing protein n=1 Tax=Thermosulfurimonas sp. F29 TaxID=2867247 RepID=UPI001C82DD2A|nr:carboxypeptidase regulatory-like domain-containing protein [Thermosulfurimonas sp. F29]MBX6424252.1 carboxypeptidase regulatory-like domain-containing protein [Thermosulfurimonas sp. F29]